MLLYICLIFQSNKISILRDIVCSVLLILDKKKCVKKITTKTHQLTIITESTLKSVLSNKQRLTIIYMSKFSFEFPESECVNHEFVKFAK